MKMFFVGWIAQHDMTTRSDTFDAASIWPSLLKSSRIHPTELTVNIIMQSVAGLIPARITPYSFFAPFRFLVIGRLGVFNFLFLCCKNRVLARHGLPAGPKCLVSKDLRQFQKVLKLGVDKCRYMLQWGYNLLWKHNPWLASSFFAGWGLSYVILPHVV